MKDYIQGKELSLSVFLKNLFSENRSRLFPNNHFPTDKMLNEFLDTIKERSDKLILAVLRTFIIHNCTFNIDRLRIPQIVNKNDAGKIIYPQFEGRIEYDIRVINHHLDETNNVWEGLTWTLDLLPHFPKEAINAINAYFLANCQALPDSYLHSLSDCSAIIRARYIDYQHPNELYYNLSPKEFEILVAELYKKLGYTVSLTQSSYDGGIDVIAEKKEITLKEKLVIQCKRYTKQTIGVKDIRNLLGVVTHFKATKGVFVTTSKFSSEAKKFERNNPSIELINLIDLNKLLNANLGYKWIHKIDNLIMSYKMNTSIK